MILKTLASVQELINSVSKAKFENIIWLFPKKFELTTFADSSFMLIFAK